MQILHHGDEDTAAGFGWTDAALLVIALIVLGAIGYGLWKLVQRMR